MKPTRTLSLLTAIVAFSAAPLVSGWADQASPAQGQTTAGTAAVPAAQGPPKVCLDVRTNDNLTKAFADRLRKTIAASGTFSLGSMPGPCNLQLHVPGNLLRFETAGGVMVSTVVIVTSPSGHYLSSSITACQATNLKPCAVRAIAAAKLALLVANDGA
ncbi:MAG: hypothetical protein ACREV7_03385 [Steroidobacteraceae bacterium]